MHFVHLRVDVATAKYKESMPSNILKSRQQMLYCSKCGHMVHESAPACPQCGAPRFAGAVAPYGASPKSRLVALLFCLFLGGLGIHRFYVGKNGTGLLWLLTLGFVGIGALIDLILIASGSFKDGAGLPVLDWEARG
jgi:hypothetical protein